MSASVINSSVLQKKKRARLGLPLYSFGEEVCNSITHGIGVLLGIAQLVSLLCLCRKDPVTVASVSIYGGSMILLYLISTMYHALWVNRAKKVFRVLDHCTIYLLIAGTYTPLMLQCDLGKQGICMLVFVWCAALLGIALNAIDMHRFRVFSMVCYLVLGWAVVLILPTLLKNINTMEFIFILSGGIAYTLGAVLYGLGKKHAYVHSVWHLFVLAGSISQFFAVLSVSVR